MQVNRRRIEQGKGRKDRYAMLSPQLLELLRDWYDGAAMAPDKPDHPCPRCGGPMQIIEIFEAGAIPRHACSRMASRNGAAGYKLMRSCAKLPRLRSLAAFKRRRSASARVDTSCTRCPKPVTITGIPRARIVEPSESAVSPD
jgi:integrase